MKSLLANSHLLPVTLSLIGILMNAVSAEAATKQIALTFDDLPGWGYAGHTTVQGLSKIAHTLQNQHIPATGFLIGGKTADAPDHMEAVEAWAKAGLPLANHSWSHQKYSSISIETFIDELKRTENLLEPLRKKYGPWTLAFRFPMLNQGDTPEKEAAANAYFEATGTLLAHVSVDTSDWAFANYFNDAPPSSVAKILRLYQEHILDCLSYAEEASQQIFGRQIPQILLLHATGLNASALPSLLKQLRVHGYEFITLDAALSSTPYSPYRHKIVYQPSDHFYFHMAHVLNKTLPTPDRTSYRYFQEHWEPQLKR